MGKTGIRPVSASVPFWISRWMLGTEVLNWYPNRNPSEEIKITTGFCSFFKGRIVESRGEEVEVEEEE